MHISGWGNTSTIRIVPPAPEPQRGTRYSTRSAQLTSPLLGLPDLGHSSIKHGKGAKIHHKHRDFLESQTPPNPVDGPELLCTGCAAALPTVKTGERREKGFSIYLWTSQTTSGERRWWEGAIVHTDMKEKSLFCWQKGFFGNNPAYCVKKKKKTKTTTHKKQTLPYHI